jgi:hypothetical protein
MASKIEKSQKNCGFIEDIKKETVRIIATK